MVCEENEKDLVNAKDSSSYCYMKEREA